MPSPPFELDSARFSALVFTVQENGTKRLSAGTIVGFVEFMIDGNSVPDEVYTTFLMYRQHAKADVIFNILESKYVHGVSLTNDLSRVCHSLALCLDNRFLSAPTGENYPVLDYRHRYLQIRSRLLLLLITHTCWSVVLAEL